jgi:hypothetical protein
MCQHYWDIEPNNGVISEGTCIYCGETKKFSNVLPDDYFQRFQRMYSKEYQEIEKITNDIIYQLRETI